MEIRNHFISVAYELFVKREDLEEELMLVEKTTKEHPFSFISGLGFALPKFEENIIDTRVNDMFEFTIGVKDAYGEFEQAHVVTLAKDVFCIDGKFDDARIFPGNVIPLMNEDGNHFEGLVKEIKEDSVIIDLNHPLAGKDLHFKGFVIENRPATKEEIVEFAGKLSEECSCGECSHEHCLHEEGEEHHHCGCGHCHH